jgi:septal ring factor EnvC (AmiA/AmiB activator)
VEVIYVLTPLLFLFAVIGFIYPTPLHKEIVIGKMDFGKRSWNLVPFLLSCLLMFSFSQILFEDETKKLLNENKQMESKIAKLEQKKKELEKEEKTCTAENKDRKIKIENITKLVKEIKTKQMNQDQTVDGSTNSSSSSSSGS